MSRLVTAPDGFTCNGLTPVDCVGKIAGSADSPANAALFQVQAYAAGAGTGIITVIVDPSKAVPDQDRSNNTKTISVSVK